MKMKKSDGDHKFNVGDSAILDITFELAEIHGGETFDDARDIKQFVRGDIVDILDVIHIKQPVKSHPVLAVIYNPKTIEATVISTRYLKPVKGTVDVGQLGGKNMKIKGGIINAGHLTGAKKISF